MLKQIRVVQDSDGLSAEGPDQSGSRSGHTGWSVSFRVEAPAATSLELSATNGPVGVYEMTGRMLLETQNGPLAISRCSGDIAARTQNGPLAVTLSGTRWVGRGLSAHATNGPGRPRRPAQLRRRARVRHDPRPVERPAPRHRRGRLRARQAGQGRRADLGHHGERPVRHGPRRLSVTR
jgi:hypothetical protein